MKHLAWSLVLVAGCTCKKQCAPGQVYDHGACRDVAVSLQGLRWEMPCQPGHGNSCEAAVDKPTKTATLGGDPAITYDVTLHFRGVVEQQSYDGGSADGLWYVGGHSADGNYNIYELRTSAPAQVFFLNAGKAGIFRVWPLDYQKTIRVQGGSSVTIAADAQDHRLIANVGEHDEPIIVPGVPPAPAKFDGQFIQMDVISVVPAAR